MSSSTEKTFQIEVPSKIMSYSESTLKNYTREQAHAELKKAYDNIVSDINNKVEALKKDASQEDLEKINTAYSTAMQQLGTTYNKEYDEILSYYQKQTSNKTDSTQTQKTTATQSTAAKQNRIMELRNTPGYQNYVVSTAKDINGVVGSSVYKKYYSDISAELYFNGHWFEDITSVQWHVQRQTLPLYGYNSYIYDDVALGNRIIYGMFSINFTEPDKLRDVISQSKVEAKADTDTASYEKLSKAQNTATITVNGTKTSIITNDAHEAIWSPRFDIDIVFGESDVLKSSVILPKHIILWDCQLQGSSIAMATNDGVLQENYQFLARDFKVIKEQVNK